MILILHCNFCFKHNFPSHVIRMTVYFTRYHHISFSADHDIMQVIPGSFSGTIARDVDFCLHAIFQYHDFSALDMMFCTILF